MSLIDHARRELDLVGLFDEDSDYNGMIGNSVMELIEVFSKQRHSGASASITRELFDYLASYKPLTEFTSNSDEWNDVGSESGRPMWQSKRNPSCFSEDGGQTWYDIAGG